MKYRFRELVDIPSLQELTDELYKATSIPSAIVDMEGDILTGSGWQRICTEFHRKHPEIEKDCIESDTRIREQLDKGESYAIYKCPRGLVDASSPVIIDGEHVANVFIGQLFFEPPDAETERLFREQAKKFGLDEEKYIEAYHEVPVYPEVRFRSALSFLSKFAQLVASIGLTRMKEKIAEEAWRKSQLFNETILNSSPDVIYVYDIIERMNVYSNDGIMNVLGYTAQDMKDMGDKLIAIIMHPDDFQIYLKETLPRYQSAEDNEFIKHEYRMKNKDGEWRWLHSQESVFMRLEDGTPKQIFGIIRDITEQKKTAGALRVSEEKYRSFVEDFHGIAFRGDLNFKPSFFHGAVEEITGYSEKEFVAGKLRWDQVVHSEDFKAILLEDVGRLQTIPDYSNVREYRIIHKNGDIRWVQETINNICDDSGKPAIVQGTICDITEHKLAEITINTTLEKLKHSQDELDRMFQFADYMVCIADLEKGYFTKISPAFTRRLGWSEKELLSKPILDFIHPDDVKKTADIIEEQMEKGLDVLQFENRYRTKKGDFRWFEWSANPIPEEGITYSAAYDITERKKAEEALRDSEAKKNALISNISDVIAILDEQGVVQYKSPNIEQHFGWLPEDLVGTDGWETVHID
ncbi:MAG: PAS domain S-box protein, partial [bacterium]|nr:PAS domain S-box protein [bacterium]